MEITIQIQHFMSSILKIRIKDLVGLLKTRLELFAQIRKEERKF